MKSVIKYALYEFNKEPVFRTYKDTGKSKMPTIDVVIGMLKICIKAGQNTHLLEMSVKEKGGLDYIVTAIQKETGFEVHLKAKNPLDPKLKAISEKLSVAFGPSIIH